MNRNSKKIKPDLRRKQQDKGKLLQSSDKEQKQPSYPRKSSAAPVKKIPNVHSVGSPPPGAGDAQLVRRQLVQERHRNKILQMEVERLRKSLEVCKKTVKEKSGEIESKNKLINKLIEDKTRIESVGSNMEEDIDIDNLLHANLGEVDLSELLNISDSAFPDNLDSLDMSSLEANQVNLSLSPSSLAMATNTSYIVEEEEDVQLPNREGSTEEEGSGIKGVVGQLVQQKRSVHLSEGKEKQTQKVSPIKIIKGHNMYQLANKKKQKAALTEDYTSPCKKLKMSSPVPEVSTAPQQCLSCPHCSKQFPLGGQWKLTRHISTAHNVPDISCQYCDKKFTCQSVLIAHNEWHKLTSPWQCGECGYRLGNLSQFLKHVKSVHRVTSLDGTYKLLSKAR